MSEYKKTTIVFPVRDNDVSLGMKRRGFGANWWNGYGGKLAHGETYEMNAIRETEEECGLLLDATMLRHVADLAFRFDGGLDVVSRAYIATGFTGEPQESEEMRNPQWFPLDQLPYDTMWPGDDQWVPRALTTTAVMGCILDFTKDNEFKGITHTDPELLKAYF
jgi:8-oxo-dGTP diphosphatase